MDKKNKIWIIVIAIIAIIPFGYKQYLNKTIITQINNLKTQGFTVIKKKDNSSYLTTSQSYQIVFSNPTKIYNIFLKDLVKPSQQQTARKFVSSLSGSKLEADINILNFPVTHQKAISIYLTSLPSKIDLSSNPASQQLKQFLANKGLGVIFSTNAFGKIISAKLKDINKKFSNKQNSIQVKVTKLVTKFSKSDFKHYNYAFTTTNSLFDTHFIFNNSNDFSTKFKNLKCTIDRKNLFNNSLFCHMDNFDYNISNSSQKTSLALNQIAISSMSATISDAINYRYKYTIKDINFVNNSYIGKKNIINIHNFVYKGSIDGLQKKAMKEITKLSYNSQYILRQEYINILQNIFNHGFVFNIEKLGIGSANINSSGKSISINPIKIKLKLTVLKNNIDISQRINPFILMKYLNIKANITFTKKDFDTLNNLDKKRKLSQIAKIAKFDGDNVIYDIKFRDGKLTINNKQL